MTWLLDLVVGIGIGNSMPVGGGSSRDASKRRCDDDFEFENYEAIMAEQEALDASAEHNRDMVGPGPRMPVGHDGSPTNTQLGGEVSPGGYHGFCVG